MEKFSIAEAKNKLPAIVHAVDHGPPAILTRHGAPVAVVISMEQYELMTQHKPDFWSAFVQFTRSHKRNEIEFAHEDFDNLRDKSIGRDVNL